MRNKENFQNWPREKSDAVLSRSFPYSNGVEQTTPELGSLQLGHLFLSFVDLRCGLAGAPLGSAGLVPVHWLVFWRVRAAVTKTPGVAA